MSDALGVHQLLGLPGPVALAAICGLLLVETVAQPWVVLPGGTAVLLAGTLASWGGVRLLVSVPVLIAVLLAGGTTPPTRWAGGCGAGSVAGLQLPGAPAGPAAEGGRRWRWRRTRRWPAPLGCRTGLSCRVCWRCGRCGCRCFWSWGRSAVVAGGGWGLAWPALVELVALLPWLPGHRLLDGAPAAAAR